MSHVVHLLNKLHALTGALCSKRKQLGSGALVALMLLTILVLPNFATPPGQADEETIELLENILPALPGEEISLHSGSAEQYLSPGNQPIDPPEALDTLAPQEPVTSPEEQENPDVTEPDEGDPEPDETQSNQGPTASSPSEEADIHVESKPSAPTEEAPIEEETAPLPAEPDPDEQESEQTQRPETSSPAEPEETEPAETENEDPRLSLTLQDLPAPDYYYDTDIVPLTYEQQTIALSIAAEYELPVELLYAIMRVETHYTTDVISATDDYGIMQINICNHEMFYERLGITDFLDYESNVRCGAYMLRLCKNYSQTLPQLLMCYNRGVGGAQAAWEEGIVFDRYCDKITTQLLLLLEARNADQA